jgi:hopanoid biosynthesis associated protein HpnK
VITADDFGLAQEVNEAVETAHRQGVLSAASLMVAGPAAAHAVALAKRMPALRVGLHLTLLDGAPALPPREIPGLVDAQGRLRGDMVALAFDLALHASARDQVHREIAAQFAGFRKTGLALDHVNAHKHFHVHPLVASAVLAACRDNGAPALRIPREPAAVLTPIDASERPQTIMSPWIALLRWRARRAGLLTPDAVFGLRWSGQMTSQRLAALLAHLPGGLIEIYTHPATSDSFTGHAPGYRYTQELAALTDPAVIAALRQCAHRLGGYADYKNASAAQQAGETNRWRLVFLRHRAARGSPVHARPWRR